MSVFAKLELSTSSPPRPTYWKEGNKNNPITFPATPHPTHWLSKCSTLLTVVTQINTYSQKHIVLLSFWREPERERHMLWGKKLQFLTWSFGVWAEEFHGFNRVSSTDVWYEKYSSHKWITKENHGLVFFLLLFTLFLIIFSIVWYRIFKLLWLCFWVFE